MINKIPNRTSRSEILIAFALCSLLLGLFYYWLLRVPDSAFLLSVIPENRSIVVDSSLAASVGWLPTFLHVFSFSILTVLVLGDRATNFSCALWAIVNAGFEVGQALPDDRIVRLPEFLNLHQYLVSGTFSYLDLMACLLGAVVAWLLLSSISTGRSQKQSDHETAVP
ncbi:MAG: hypothetical protein KUF72_08105 [Candidatus Thiodiazotropha sp. (ex Ctena orbiculata)]|nr:hypothetical protein [Candidatus Thiodiazotropha taylori]